ncbi:hypothetical protein H8K38_17955 [Undibacterium sp. FT79W]|uniref:hypothetical protein n=1 Tax=Undibacterium sp. FT79W TaxID=2762296 RepID=UPI00164A1CD7|nr:hypothetical protein [Undibacterium sp. FT79W]MBC3879696.1 hypothetical protein [Undibacterium sp. FT79W]
MKIFRIANYVLLLSFILSIGDWPFVDEILEEQAALQSMISTLDTAQADAESTRLKQESLVSHSSGSIYQSLTNFVDMPRHNLVVAVASERTAYFAEEPSFVSVTAIPAERPPSLSLS